MRQFIHRLVQALIGLPQELLAGLWRLLLLLLLLILYLLRLLWEAIRRGASGKEEGHTDRPRCNKVPESVKRKPDPCLYSQFYLAPLGYAVTWDNPDIWVTKPDGTPAPSGDLAPDADYVVHVRISDASFDPALATEVRCFYRPWTFNSMDRVPVEVRTDGSEQVVLLHIPSWSAQIATFRWHTPANPGHYCIQAECRHSDDMNPNNNLGQENTSVVGASAGTKAVAKALLVNRTKVRSRFRIVADRYAIPDRKVALRLKRRPISLRRRRPFEPVHRAMLSVNPTRRCLEWEGAAPARSRYAYTGWAELRRGNARGEFPILGPWVAAVEGHTLNGGAVAEIVLGPGEARELSLEIQIPPGTPPRSRTSFNFSAFTEHGSPEGGVTLIVEARP